ncbi:MULTISPECIES: signal peptidase I [unclassified Streptomyces]|uniref:signal peptidase I n=1 Tax=unclassified Streptomyces TaxID=2593676 RepID=UPI000BAC5C7F|nr:MULTISPECIES: signal peptidase I [unclassified Streptomyces]ASY32570.1 signal peptidase I [Streptomyces sp. CLI2509]MYX19811.1 signal peptidase I [Streptomyces sp. SID8380]
MDTETQDTERDRSAVPNPSAQATGRAVEGPRSRLSWLPGGVWTVAGLALVVVLLLVSRFVAQPFGIPSASMEPALHVGDRVMVDKLAYRFGGEPRRGDVVVFDGTGYFGDGDYIKRVVGVGGDRVRCCAKDGRLTINGKPVTEPFLHAGDTPSDVAFDIVVPAGRLFVLGDHRADSADSRDHLGSPGGGMIPLSAVRGRADLVVWPPSRWNGLQQRDAYAPVPAPSAAAHG